VGSELAALDRLRELVLLDSLEMFQMHFLEGHFRLLQAHCQALLSECQWFAAGRPVDDMVSKAKTKS
jgi:hypothetical protein